jgi:hypothetical protein
MIDWKKLYMELWCAVWLAQPSEFEEDFNREGDEGSNHAQTIAEVNRMNA